MDITCERNVQGTDIKSKRNIQGMDVTSERTVQSTDIACERNLQGTYSCLQDGNHTDGHYITLFAEQLTRTFEVLVLVVLT